MRRELTLLLVSALSCHACAMMPEERLSPRLANVVFAEGPYNRNVIACVPTKAGEGIFMFATLPVFFVAIPLILAIGFGEIERPSALHTIWDTTIDGAQLFIIGGSLVIGAPFIPFSYLAPESRCSPLLDYTFSSEAEGADIED